MAVPLEELKDPLCINKSDTDAVLIPSMGSSSSSLTSGHRHPSRTPTPRQSISTSQAIDMLHLGVTQAVDLQHLFEQYDTQVDNHTAHIKQQIDTHFDDLIAQLMERKKKLHQQVEQWQATKQQLIEKETTSAAKYEQTFIKAQRDCQEIGVDHRLSDTQKLRSTDSIKSEVFRSHVMSNDEQFEKYGNSKLMADHINTATSLIGIEYARTFSLPELCTYGEIKVIGNDTISIPTLHLLPPTKVKELKDGYKLMLKWQTSQSLIAENFILRCVCKNDADDNGDGDGGDDDSKQQAVGASMLQTLKFHLKECDSSVQRKEYETAEIEYLFSFDATYTLRVEYHLRDPVNLLIASNDCEFGVVNKPPQSNTAHFINLACAKHRGNSYEGSPQNLLIDDDKKYSSVHNDEFAINEIDWIVFKLNDSGFVRQFLPKAILVRNSFGAQAVKRLVVSIGGKADTDEWYKYDEVSGIKADGEKYQKFILKGVDWKVCKDMRSQYIKLEFLENYGESRGKQCRFKVSEFQIYGLEFD